MQLLDRPRQVTHDKPAADVPKGLILRQAAVFPNPLRHDAVGRRRDVYANPPALELLGGDEGGTTTAECVQHDVVLV
jgi:hypothetical protein